MPFPDYVLTTRTNRMLKGLDAKRISEAKTVKFASPVLPIMWAKLGTPQTGGEYDGEYGKYRFDLVIDPADPTAAEFIDRIEQNHASLIKVVEEWKTVNRKTKLTNFRGAPVHEQTVKVKTNADIEKYQSTNPDIDIEIGDYVSTGKYVLKLSKNAAYNKDGAIIDTPFNIVDSNNRRVPKSILAQIGNGTEVRVALQQAPYVVSDAAGTCFKVPKIVITKLVKYGEGMVDSDYFGDDDIYTGGFTVDTEDTEENLSAGDVSVSDDF